jgi:hypothetical protein
LASVGESSNLFNDLNAGVLEGSNFVKAPSLGLVLVGTGKAETGSGRVRMPRFQIAGFPGSR